MATSGMDVAFGRGHATMNADTEDRITTLEPGQEPKASILIEEMKEHILAASSEDVYAKLEHCHNVRRCQWAGKPAFGDGRQADGKDGEGNAWRWKGAPILSVPTADRHVRWHTLIESTVDDMGDMRIQPRRAAAAPTGGEDLAEVWQNTLEYFLDEGDRHQSYQSKLFDTCKWELGYALQLVEVEKTMRNELRTMNVQQLTDALVKRAQDELMQQAMEAADGAEIDPREVITAEVMQTITESIAIDIETLLASAGKPTPWALEIVAAVDERISDKEAAKVLSQLRDDPTAEAEYVSPKEDGCVVKLETLVPWVNCIHPNTMDGECRTDAIYIPRYKNETQLREHAMRRKWDAGTLQTLIESHKNQFFAELCTSIGATLPGWGLNGMGIGLIVSTEALNKFPHWMFVEVYRRITDKFGRPMVYRGAFHPNMPDKMLEWSMTDLTELPILGDTSEPVGRAMEARGVPQIVVDKQNFVKDSLDNEGARSQLGSNRPLLRTSGVHAGISPGKELFAKRSGNSFEGSQFMDVPDVDMGTLKLIEIVDKLVDDYYFNSATTSPEDKRAYRQSLMMNAKRLRVARLRLMWTLLQEKIDRVQASSINGRAVNLDARRDQLQGAAAISIGVHVDGLSQDAAEKFIKVWQMMLQNDRGGTLDYVEGMNMIMRLFAPAYAPRLIMSRAAASGRIVDEQQQRITKIMAGIPLEYPEKPSAPEMRLQVLQQWQSIPDNMMKLQSDRVAAFLMQKEQEWLRFQNQQQNVNAVTGRTGVTANTAEEMAAA
jgi:hypothetical protein